MGYRDIKISSKTNIKENLSPVFSEFIGEIDGEGKIDKFIDDTMKNCELPSNIKSDPFEKKFNEDLIKLLNTFKSNYSNNKRWLTLMGLIERKILQLRCYKNPTLAFSIQDQKSGDNIFSYIVIRAFFVDLYSGKKEIRRYFNKMEDYPNFNSLEELKSDANFINEALVEIKSVMAELINKDISIVELEAELIKLEKSSRAANISSPTKEAEKKKEKATITEMYDKSIDEIDEMMLSMKLEEEEEMIGFEKRRKKRDSLKKLAVEYRNEILRHENELLSIEKNTEDKNWKEILKTKEIAFHTDQINHLKFKNNLDF